MKFYQVLTYPALTGGLYLIPLRGSRGFFAGLELPVIGFGITIVLGLLFLYNLVCLAKSIRTKFSTVTLLFGVYLLLQLIPYHLLSTAHDEKIPDYTISVQEHDWKDPPKQVQQTVYEGEKTAKHFFVIGSLLFFGCSLFWYSSSSNKLSILLYPLHLLCGCYLFLNYA